MLALAAGEERAVLLHGVGRERGAEHAEERRRDERVEDHRRLHRRALAWRRAGRQARSAASLPQPPASRSSSGAADGVGVAGLDLAVLLGEHIGERVALVGAEAAAHTGRAGDEDLGVAVDVHGVLDGLDARVGRQSRSLYLSATAMRCSSVASASRASYGSTSAGSPRGPRQRGVLVRVADGGVVDGARRRRRRARAAEVGGDAWPTAPSAEDAHAHALAARRGELLDLLPVDLDAA